MHFPFDIYFGLFQHKYYSFSASAKARRTENTNGDNKYMICSFTLVNYIHNPPPYGANRQRLDNYHLTMTKSYKNTNSRMEVLRTNIFTHGHKFKGEGIWGEGAKFKLNC